MKDLLTIITLSIISCSFTTLKAQMITYSGPVEYSFKVVKTAGGGGTDGGYDWNVTVNESRIITGSFYVTFTGGNAGVPGFSNFMLTSVEENIDFVNTVNNEGKEQKTSQICRNENTGESYEVSPGDSRTRGTNVVSSVIDTDKPVITGGQLMIKGDEYTFFLFGEIKMEVTYETFKEEIFPCLKSSEPPRSFTNTSTFEFPIAINAKKELENPKYMEGTYVHTNTSSDKCNEVLPGDIARMAHGDMACSSITDIRTSWMLVKKTKECDGNVSYLKGDVKINGVPAQKGNIKVGAGDVITTGPKSRVSFSLKNGNETYMLGSKSKLQLVNPCKPDTYKPLNKEEAVMKFIKGKIFGQRRNPTTYTREDFDSDIEWEHFKSRNINWFSTTAVGVRAWNSDAPTVYFASTDPTFNYRFDLPSWIKPIRNYHSYSPDDPEKEELIPDINSIPENANAFYIHCENGEVKDFTVVKGTLKIEDDLGFRSMDIPEGTTVNKWQDGTQMTKVFINEK